MEYGIIIAVIAAWFYSDELVSFLQLDRAGRMADRRLDRLEDEQVSIQTAYYSSKDMPSDETVKKAIEGKKRMQTLRNSL